MAYDANPVTLDIHEQLSGGILHLSHMTFDLLKQSLVTMSGTRIILFHLDQERVEAFRNPRVRQAIAYAINQEGIAAKIMKGFATPVAFSAWWPVTWAAGWMPS